MFIINTVSTCFGHHYAHHQENKDRVLLHVVCCAGSAGCGWQRLWGAALYGASTVKVTVRPKDLLLPYTFAKQRAGVTVAICDGPVVTVRQVQYISAGHQTVSQDLYKQQMYCYS